MAQNSDWAIVIPTLNEEKYIGILLDSLAAQTLLPNELLVVDACSKDNTEEQVLKRKKQLPQIKFHQMPKSSIARQRNYGAYNTASNHILFLDADMMLDPEALEKYDQEITKKKPDIAAAINRPLSKHWQDKLLFDGMDLAFKILKPIWPMAQGMNMYISRDALKKYGGFDEEITVGEDHEIVQRMSKKGGKFIYLKEPKVFTSTRRMNKVGYIRFVTMMTFSLIFVVFMGYKKNPIQGKYEFGQHSDT